MKKSKNLVLGFIVSTSLICQGCSTSQYLAKVGEDISNFSKNTWSKVKDLSKFSNIAILKKNPVTKRQEIEVVSIDEEIMMGNENFTAMVQASGGELKTFPELNEYISRVGNTIAQYSDRPDLPYEFIVINNSTPNIWSLPGGKIAITRGLLTEIDSEAELAAVLAHEIVHTAARHGAKCVERGMLSRSATTNLNSIAKDLDYSSILCGEAAVAANLITLPNESAHEIEADQYAMIYMTRAGYNPEAVVLFQEKLLQARKDQNPLWMEGILATHPTTEERIYACDSILSDPNFNATGNYNREEYQEAIKDLASNEKAYRVLDRAYSYYINGDLEEALTLAEDGAELLPYESHFFGLQGKIYLLNNDKEAAEWAFNRAISLNNQYFEYYLNRGLIREATSDFAGAKEDMQTSALLLPTAEANSFLGYIELEERNDSQAVEHFRLVMTSESDLKKDAMMWVAKLDVPKNPQKYIQFQASRDKYGFLLLKATNNSPVPVNQLSVVLDVLDDEGDINLTRFVRFPATEIKPGEKATIATGLGPFTDDEITRGAIVADIANLKTADWDSEGWENEFQEETQSYDDVAISD